MTRSTACCTLIFIFPLFANPLDPPTLVKVGLISEACGLSSSSVAFIQYGLVDRRLALTLVGGSIPFVVAGALLSFVLPEPVFHALLGVALPAAADGGTPPTESAATELPDDSGKLGPAVRGRHLCKRDSWLPSLADSVDRRDPRGGLHLRRLAPVY